MVTPPAPVDPRPRRARGLALSLGPAAARPAILAAAGWRARATPSDVSGLTALTDCSPAGAELVSRMIYGVVRERCAALRLGTIERLP